ncbi:MAG: SLC26A/SulP transporter family protein [Acidobacteria bacterium]|nr:SLC26A/SulP transporter family protein [Acidobacteriota bacterium]
MATGEGGRAAPAAAEVRPAPGLVADLWAGLAAMLVALPSAIAFGVTIFVAASPSLAGAGALAGIVGAAALGVTAPLVSRNSGFITAPCAPAAAVMAGFALQLAADGKLTADQIVALLALTALVSALLQFIYGAVRLGRVIKYIPFQVVSGYLSGVAVIIAVAQIPKLLGVPKGTRFWEGLIAPQQWGLPDVIVGVVTMATMFLAPRLTKKVPGAIIGLGSGIAAYFLLAIVRPGLLQLTNNPHVIGPIRASGSFLDAVTARVGALGHIDAAAIALVLGPAITLSALLSIDTLKTGVVLDALTRKRHDSNRELIAQGSANAVSFLAGGIPGAGTMGASLVNVTSGSRTMWSSVIEGGLALVTFLVLSPLVAWVPTGALAGILLVVAIRMFDFRMFKLLVTPGTRLDFVVIATVIIVAEGVGLIEASLVGVCLAIVLFIRDQINGSVILRKRDLREARSKRRRSEEEALLLGERGEQAAIVELQGNLFFGTTDQLFSELDADLSSRRFILLDFRRVQSMDYTAGHLFHQMHERLHDGGGELLFCGMPSSLPSRQDIQHYMSQLGLVGGGEGITIFDTRDSAIEWMEQRILEYAGWVPQEARPPLELGETSLFRGIDPVLLTELGETARSFNLKAGELLFSAGDAGDEMFLIRKGRIHILLPLEAGKRHHLATFARGDFFGEMSFLDQQKRSADAEAGSDCQLYALSRDAFETVIRRHPEVAAHFFGHLSLAMGQRLRVTGAELRALEER